MRIHRKVAQVVAEDGLPGLLRRGTSKLMRSFLQQKAEAPRREELEQPRAKAVEAPTGEERERARARESFPTLVRQFHDEVRARKLGDVENFFWYHSVDLGGGLVTPGDYDFRGVVADYPFPESMQGMSALDVGSATGFFAFELERRGANVTSVDLPSLLDWDMIWSEREPELQNMMSMRQASSLEALHWRLLEGPFQFCHRLLGSRVRRCLSRIYDLTPEKLGSDGFDLVFLGDILGHLFSPLQALNVLAPLCRGTMIISYSLSPISLMVPSEEGPGGSVECPLMQFQRGDSRAWFQPNWACLRLMLERLGFRDIQKVGTSRVLVRRTGTWMDREIIRAAK